MLDSWKNRMIQKKEAFRNAEEQAKIQRLIEQKQKGSNERELERFHEEQRQEMIKAQLERFRRKRKEELSKNIFKNKPMFNGPQTVLNNNEKVFKDKSYFMGKASLLNSRRVAKK